MHRAKRIAELRERIARADEEAKDFQNHARLQQAYARTAKELRVKLRRLEKDAHTEKCQ